MTAGRIGTLLAIVLVGSVVSGCKKHDPPPSHNKDLGEDGRRLPPTAGAVHNVAISQGTADWLEFREPKIPSGDRTDTRPRGESADAEGDDAGVDAGDEAADAGEVDKEIRELLSEYNDKVASGALDEVLGFLTEAQAETAEPLFATLVTLNEKLGALAAAMPDQAAAIEGVRAKLSAVSMLKIEPASVRADGDSAAVVTMAASPLPTFLAGISDEAKANLEVRMTLGEDEYWYIDSPVIAALGGAESSLKDLTAEIDGLVTGGDASALASAALLGPMLKSVSEG